MIPTQEPKGTPIQFPTGGNAYPDLYLPIPDNYRISDMFYWYTDSISPDNNPMILVELTGPSYRYGPTVYAVDIVNGTMYGMFDIGFRVISESVTLKPQYIGTPLSGMHGPTQVTQVSTLVKQMQLITPMGK